MSETPCDCDLCKIRRGLLEIQKILDSLPEIGSEFYDDPIGDINSLIDNNFNIYYCLDEYEKAYPSRLP